MLKNNDKYYIEKILKGDVNAFSFLVNKYKNLSYTLAFRILKNKEDAEETVQDAFLKAYRSLNDFKSGSSFATWLYRIVYNTSISKTRLNRKNKDVVDIENINHIFISDSGNAFNKLKEDDQKYFIQKAIDKLDEDESAVVTLYYYEELSVDEINKITGLTHSNIKIKLYRARKKLLKFLEASLKDDVRAIL